MTRTYLPISVMLALLGGLMTPARPVSAAPADAWVGDCTPESVRAGLKRLGLTQGEYGLYDDVQAWEASGEAGGDERWKRIVLRYQAIEVSEAVAGLSDKRKRRRMKADAKTLLRSACRWIGPAASELSAEVDAALKAGMSEGDRRWKDLAGRCETLGRRFARDRIRIAYVNPDALEAAIRDLIETFGKEYPHGAGLLARLPEIRERVQRARRLLLEGKADGLDVAGEVFAFQQEALLANPLLRCGGILAVKRSTSTALPPWRQYGSSCEVYSARADNEIALLPAPGSDTPGGTLYRPEGMAFVAHLEVDFDARTILFTQEGQLMELDRAGGEPRQVITDQPSFLNSFDGCYLPDGRIIFSSTAGHKGVPCDNGGTQTQSLFLLSKDRTSIRRLTFDQDHDWHPTVANDGRVLYTRWDYTDAHHYYARLLFAMNPDGSGQMALYGSNSYFPNGKLYTRAIPWQDERMITVEIGHVEPIGRLGRLLLLDVGRSGRETGGVVQAVPGRNTPIYSHANFLPIRDHSAPRFTEPWPLSDAEDPRGAGKYFLASVKLSAAEPHGIYLVDVFDNLVLVGREAGWDFREPIPLRPRRRPPVIPDRVDPSAKTAEVNLVDVYSGDGLAGVPRGTVKALRLYAYHFGYHGIGGHHTVGINSGWDCRRILGTVPVHEDGSAFFEVPANLPIAVQPLDEKGQALQIMRSWFTLMPGETASCVGCHEARGEVPDSAATNLALRKAPSPIRPWYGPDRPYSYVREVQPVLDRYCVGCHDGSRTDDSPLCYDLRGEDLSTHQPDKVHEYPYPDKVRYPLSYFPPSYRILQRYARRPMLESDYVLRNPGEYLANTSPLVQMLRKGHHGVTLNDEAWDRLITWIDLNVPCHGTWTEIAARQRGNKRGVLRVAEGIKERLACDEAYGGPGFNPEVYPDLPPALPGPSIVPDRARRAAPDVEARGWPMSPAEARERQQQLDVEAPRIELGDAGSIELVAIPAGSFVMGDAKGYPDERPHAARIDRPIWMATREITNAQYAQFDPTHYSGYFDNLGKNNGRKGRPLNEPAQPVIRVSWHEARAFCQWLSQRTGLPVRLPTEAEWEYACRAGAETSMHYGPCDADFSKHENLADRSLLEQNYFFYLAPFERRNVGMRYNVAPFSVNNRFDDGLTSPDGTGKLAPNAFGLYDMHGNVQEWTSSTYLPYPYRADKAREGAGGPARRVARGGSWADRPRDARAGIRRPYHPWQRVHNVGLRIVVDMPPDGASAGK